ncbi:NADPH-dependent FMN reductase [Alteribacillus sp. HJP-4]|uniref:NADPH-dependent FMN reductase n=1 Tax=Alteribacillus sp. HJP-4 TaxID=2775394 RepID=UPI0035CD001C
MKTLIIAGSAREHSNSGIIASIVDEVLQNSREETMYFDLSVHTLPIFSGTVSEETHPDIQLLRSYAAKADGIIICTPEYHSSISGALKNALDFLGPGQFEGKATAILAAAGGGKGGINALNTLRLILRSLHAEVLSDQLVVDAGRINPRKGTIDPQLQQRLEQLLQQYMKWIEIYKRLNNKSENKIMK